MGGHAVVVPIYPHYGYVKAPAMWVMEQIQQSMLGSPRHAHYNRLLQSKLHQRLRRRWPLSLSHTADCIAKQTPCQTEGHEVQL